MSLVAAAATTRLAAASTAELAATELAATGAALAHGTPLELKRLAEHLFPGRLLAGCQHGDDLLVQFGIALFHLFEVRRTTLESTLAALRGAALEATLATLLGRPTLTAAAALALLRRSALEPALALRRSALEATLAAASALTLGSTLRATHGAIRLQDLLNLVALLVRQAQLFADLGAKDRSSALSLQRQLLIARVLLGRQDAL